MTALLTGPRDGGYYDDRRYFDDRYRDRYWDSENGRNRDYGRDRDYRSNIVTKVPKGWAKILPILPIYFSGIVFLCLCPSPVLDSWPIFITPLLQGPRSVWTGDL